MFRAATIENTPRARQQEGKLIPISIPYKGLNMRAPYVAMGKEYAIALQNVTMETFGVRTRKGSADWATNIPGGAVPIPTMLLYYPAVLGVPDEARVLAPPEDWPAKRAGRQVTLVPPVGVLFAAKNGNLYNVTAGGAGPWVAEVGVTGTSDYWTGINIQNLAGSFLIVTNDEGGYAYYNGTAWTTVAIGTGAGQISGVDPATFCYVMEYAQRLWFIEKDSTRAWYLPVNQITGVATLFDFGQMMPHGGPLACMANWTIDGGEGIDDHLVAVGYQGDVMIYRGYDPAAVATFELKGKWFCGELPVGRRQITKSGGDVHILSTLGLVPVSRLLQAAAMAVTLETESTAYLLGPLIARLMRDFSKAEGWQLTEVSREELMLIGVPTGSLTFTGEFLVFKQTNPSWSVFKDTKYRSFVSVGAQVFAGSSDGRVLQAFEGVFDDVDLEGKNGKPIGCQVTPAYQPLGEPGLAKRVLLLRPTFLAELVPLLSFRILTDFRVPQFPTTPTASVQTISLWNSALWNDGIWGGIKTPFKEWLGATGEGFMGTAQLDYTCIGDTVLTSIDFWVVQGGPL